MQSHNRDLLVVLRQEDLSEFALRHEVHCLNKILQDAESKEQFCVAHELVRRNRITSKISHLIKTYSSRRLQPFYFLINKN